ncbi:helix-turn-helix transcriptional regulator [Hymenobacter sp. AT01-02]|uniref:S24 family peptidase n=1 Tax=Hymenobacter sp. AT01-02 TaxID=1571877 RepID=UPI0005F1CC3F|nr:hypothetical protein [Hymenobacter sp. AT01-02]
MPQQTTINQRVQELIDTFSAGNKSAFARSVGISNQSVNEIVGARQSAPSFKAIQKLLLAFTEVRPEWLINGDGEMLHQEEVNAGAPEGGTFNEVFYGPNADNWMRISEALTHLRHASNKEEAKAQYVHIKKMLADVLSSTNSLDNAVIESLLHIQHHDLAYAYLTKEERNEIKLVGNDLVTHYITVGREDKEFINSLPSINIPDPIYQNGLFRCFQIADDSMAPSLSAGTYIIGKYLEEWQNNIQSNTTHIVVTQDGIIIRRAVNASPIEDILHMIPDNRSYATLKIKYEHIREIWVAVSTITHNLSNTSIDYAAEVARLRADVEEIKSSLPTKK